MRSCGAVFRCGRDHVARRTRGEAPRRRRPRAADHVPGGGAERTEPAGRPRAAKATAAADDVAEAAQGAAVPRGPIRSRIRRAGQEGLADPPAAPAATATAADRERRRRGPPAGPSRRLRLRVGPALRPLSGGGGSGRAERAAALRGIPVGAGFGERPGGEACTRGGVARPTARARSRIGPSAPCAARRLRAAGRLPRRSGGGCEGSRRQVRSGTAVRGCRRAGPDRSRSAPSPPRGGAGMVPRNRRRRSGDASRRVPRARPGASPRGPPGRGLRGGRRRSRGRLERRARGREPPADRWRGASGEDRSEVRPASSPRRSRGRSGGRASRRGLGPNENGRPRRAARLSIRPARRISRRSAGRGRRTCRPWPCSWSSRRCAPTSRGASAGSRAWRGARGRGARR